MKRINEIANLNMKKLRFAFALGFSLLILVFFFYSSFSLLQQEKEVSKYISQVLENEVSNQFEEGRLVYMVKNFNNNFDLLLNPQGTLCSSNNCYELSFYKSYLKLILTAFVFILFGLGIFKISSIVGRKYNEELINELELLSKILRGNLDYDKDLNSYEAYKILKLIKEREENLARILAAELVAHDIRSPLDALSVIKDDFDSLPEGVKEIAQVAIERMNSITNKLRDNTAQTKKLKPVYLIEDFLELKRVELKDKCIIKTEIKCSLDQEIEYDETELYRLISNLINNSADAGAKQVKLIFSVEASELKVRIQDDGSGFPKEILENGIKKGKTIGKQEGKGLGLFSALDSLTKNNGNLIISNSNGAVVDLSFQLA